MKRHLWKAYWVVGEGHGFSCAAPARWRAVINGRPNTIRIHGEKRKVRTAPGMCGSSITDVELAPRAANPIVGLRLSRHKFVVRVDVGFRGELPGSSRISAIASDARPPSHRKLALLRLCIETSPVPDVQLKR